LPRRLDGAGAFKPQDKPRVLKNIRAFTLIEIIVVMALVGTILFFAVPRMEGTLLRDDSRTVSRWIVLNVAELKTKSVQAQTPYILYVDMDNNLFEIGRESGDPFADDPSVDADAFMDADRLEAEESRQRFELPRGYRLTSVRFSEESRKTSGTATIRFHPKGYSDRASIHIRDRDNRQTIYVVEPFLSRVTIHDDHVRFSY